VDGCYTQPDPIGLEGNNPTLYGYVFNPLSQIDPFGLVWRDMASFANGGMGHHLLPRSIANTLGVSSDWVWYPNNTAGSGAIHQQLHNNLSAQGVPYHGSKYTGTLDGFYDSAGKAYNGIDTKGYTIGPNGQRIDNVTPKEALDHMRNPQEKPKEKPKTPTCNG